MAGKMPVETIKSTWGAETRLYSASGVKCRFVSATVDLAVVVLSESRIQFVAVHRGQAGEREGSDAVVQFGVVVGTKAQDVPDDVWAIVGSAKRLNVMGLGIS